MDLVNSEVLKTFSSDSLKDPLQYYIYNYIQLFLEGNREIMTWIEKFRPHKRNISFSDITLIWNKLNIWCIFYLLNQSPLRVSEYTLLLRCWNLFSSMHPIPLSPIVRVGDSLSQTSAPLSFHSSDVDLIWITSVSSASHEKHLRIFWHRIQPTWRNYDHIGGSITHPMGEWREGHEVASSEDSNYTVGNVFKGSIEGQNQKAPCMAEENENIHGRLTCEIQPEPV